MQTLKDVIIAQQKKLSQVKPTAAFNPNNNGKFFTAEEYLKLITELANARIISEGKRAQFIIDEWNRDIIWQLCLYFTNDRRFEKEKGMSLNKGIALSGPNGCGKTFIINLFRENQKRSFITRDCLIIADGYEGDNSYIVNYQLPYKNIYFSNYFGHVDNYGRCFDDLGHENERIIYGNVTNVMANILLGRDARLGSDYTHITTNLSADEIEQKYGTRIRSRFAGMFNKIDFKPGAPDRRKM